MAARYWSGIHKVADAANKPRPAERFADSATDAHLSGMPVDPKTKIEEAKAIPDAIPDPNAGILRRDVTDQPNRR